MNKTWNEENNEAIYNTSLQYLRKTAEINNKIYGLELYVTSNCNQNCEYCYLYKYGDKLYPLEYNNPELIIKNLKIFLTYLIENQIFPTKIDIFSGEILHTDFGIEILNILLEFVAVYPQNIYKELIIPTNFSFILYDKYRKKIEEFISNFRYYNTSLILSCSYDGPLIEENNRPFKYGDTKIKTQDEYIDFLFNWCKKYGFGFHPMVNANSIEKWPEQYKWWLITLKKYNMDLLNNSMFLEVRNDEWSTEKIINYLKYLNQGIDDCINYYFENNISYFIDIALSIAPRSDKDSLTNYFQFGLSNQPKGRGCSADRSYTIRLGDLTWVPCHRTSYEKLNYGQYIINNNKIIGMQALNLPLLVSINSLSYLGLIKCESCAINRICNRGCFGAQFEANKEIFYPCLTVCDLYKAKSLFLIEKYKTIYFNNSTWTPNKKQLNCFEQMKQLVENLEEKDKSKWIPVIKQILIN